MGANNGIKHFWLMVKSIFETSQSLAKKNLPYVANNNQDSSLCA